MKPGRSSRTAEHNALFRALENGAPDGRRLFDDPLAPRFLTWPLSWAGHLAAVPGGGRAVRAILDRHWPGIRTSVVARTRLIDDTLSTLTSEGMRQLVILGAGYDSRPYRLSCLREFSIFEVDHPDTQDAKCNALSHALEVLPASVTFIPSDFNLMHMESDMEASGYQPSVPTVFLWEGVTNYLSEDAVDATVRWCARATPGSALLFTYIHDDVLTHPENYIGADRLYASLNKVGERLTFGMDPLVMGDYLRQRGLTREWDLGAGEYRARYFGDRAQVMVGHEFYRVALARVKGS
jgi:methyltransferase (TIGR00027 family)